MKTYKIRAFVNKLDVFREWRPGDPMREVRTDYLIVAAGMSQAAGRMFDIGNRMAVDIKGTIWPEGTRSMSVGDVIHVADNETGDSAWLACDPVGFRQLDGGLDLFDVD